MGQRHDKLTPTVTSPDAVEDVSRKVTDSREDVDDMSYRIVITCRNRLRISKRDDVTIEISGPDERRLTVTVNNKIYYNSDLPKPAASCDYKIVSKKGADLLTLLITKSEPGLWTSKKT